ncbi:indolethylamine N-methyltransferase-like isoform X2 [Ranitomeya imitator]|uniref:indolethylamine N-methyltransferase-like isoform X2 n=1 Tax=Ranitomeya imitator TaxID=111125 RepID=UPI0037E77A44
MTTMDPCLTLYYPKYEINPKVFLEEYFSQHVPFSMLKESTINMQRCFYKAFKSVLGILQRRKDTMDPCLKLHYPSHEADVRIMLQDYFSQYVPYSVFKESTMNMLRCFYQVFSSGLVSGKTLIDISLGPIIIQLLSVCEFFEEISILKCGDASIKELELWKNKDPEAFDWTHTSKLFMEIKGASRDGWQDAEEMLRRKMKHLVKCDFTKTNPTNPFALPRADCVTCVWGLEMISRDHEEYRITLRKISNMIKLGGHILIYTDINASYFIVGQDKYHLLNCDDSFLRKTLTDEGFAIVHYENMEREACTDRLDHEQKAFIVACKVMET